MRNTKYKHKKIVEKCTKRLRIEWKRSYHTNLSWHLITSYCLFNYRITKNEQIFVSLLVAYAAIFLSIQSLRIFWIVFGFVQRVVILISTETKIGIIVECLLNRNHIIYIIERESTSTFIAVIIVAFIYLVRCPERCEYVNSFSKVRKSNINLNKLIP